MRSNLNATVSVVIPAFNRARFIEAAVGSALTQSYAPTEIIVVDDASTDATVEIVESMAKKDPRIKCVRQKPNGGPAAARNRGVRESTGELIGFLDSDDLWEPDFLNQTVRFMTERDDLGIVFTDLTRERSDGELIDASVVWNTRNLAEFVSQVPGSDDWYVFTVPECEAVLHRFLFGIQSAVLRREAALANPFDVSFRGTEDLDFGIQLGLSGVKFGFIRRIGCRTVIHGENLASNGNDPVRFDAMMADVWRKALSFPNLSSRQQALIRNQVAEHYMIVGYGLSQKRRTWQAIRYYLRSFGMRPSMRPLTAGAKSVIKRIVA